MDEILGNIPNCLAIADDVILFATSFDAMYDTLDKVLNRFLEGGIILNKQKRELFINKVEFFGFVFSEKGITPQTKIESIQNMPPPTNISELRITKFEIITDHKPLVHSFNNAQSRMPLRIERWSLRLQEFNFTISHIKGTVNPADFLSRHSFDIKTKTDNITEQYVNFVQNHACPETISL